MAVIKPVLAPDLKVLEIEPIATGLQFTESPRYKDGYVYISDMIGKTLWRLDPAKKTKEHFMSVPEQCNGSGFLSDGTFVVGSMFDQQILCIRDMKNPKLEVYKDLKPLMTGYTGDMVIDADDNVYIDDVGARLHHGEPYRPGRIIMVTPGKEMKSVAEDLEFPNGILISGDGKKLYIAESHAFRISYYDIKADGTLANRQTWFETKDVMPFGITGEGGKPTAIDGMAIDAEDALWISMFYSGCFIRLTQEGVITHRVNVDGEATALILGGENGKTLFLGSNAMPKSEGEGDDVYNKLNHGKSIGTIYQTRVDTPRGKGRP